MVKNIFTKKGAAISAAAAFELFFASNVVIVEKLSPEIEKKILNLAAMELYKKFMHYYNFFEKTHSFIEKHAQFSKKYQPKINLNNHKYVILSGGKISLQKKYSMCFLVIEHEDGSESGFSLNMENKKIFIKKRNNNANSINKIYQIADYLFDILETEKLKIEN